MTDNGSVTAPSTPSTPSTEAGKRLAEWWSENADADEQTDNIATIIEIERESRNDLERQCAQLREALKNLSDYHEGYAYSMGPCVCEPHKAARQSLSSTPQGWVNVERQALERAANEGRNVLPDATDEQAAAIELWAATALRSQQ